MFENAAEIWAEYLTLVSTDWLEDDIRYSLGAEVTDRLRQIDLIIRHLHDAIGAVIITPDEKQEQMQEQMRLLFADLSHAGHGEITHEEPDQSPKIPAQDHAARNDARDDIWIFTETFYYYAWRVMESLNSHKPYNFPCLHKVDARGVRIARNHLIEHPEKEKAGQNPYRGIFLTSSGPILRSMSVVVHLDSGKVEPQPDGKDQGLFAAAEEMRDELERRFSAAITGWQQRELSLISGRHLRKASGSPTKIDRTEISALKVPSLSFGDAVRSRNTSRHLRDTKISLTLCHLCWRIRQPTMRPWELFRQCSPPRISAPHVSGA